MSCSSEDSSLSQQEKSQGVMTLYDLGYRSDYQQVLDFQKHLVNRRLCNLSNSSLVIVEHSHVLTMGRNGKRENVLIEDLPLFEIERGGDITYHGPGQLVVYPILSLPEGGHSIRQFVEHLERIIVNVLSNFGIKSEGRLGPFTGVWTANQRKIASIGIATTHWITYHGFALNVCTDLSYFTKIRPCGFESDIMTSMSRELNQEVTLEEVKPLIIDGFASEFGLRILNSSQNNF